VVFVAKGDKAARRDIVIGQSNDTYAEVLQGLSKEELLIVSGQLNIKDGDDIRIVK